MTFTRLPFENGILTKGEFLNIVRVIDKEVKKRKRSHSSMIVYVVFRKNYVHKKGELMGMLVERRKDMRGQTQWESSLKWARWAFGHLVKDKKDIFVFPKEMKISDDKILLVGKGILTPEEFSEVVKGINQEMDRERK
jgi:hypothetical protein